MCPPQACRADSAATKHSPPPIVHHSLADQHVGGLLHPCADVSGQALCRLDAARLAGLQHQARHGHKVGAGDQQAHVCVDDAYLRRKQGCTSGKVQSRVHFGRDTNQGCGAGTEQLARRKGRCGAGCSEGGEGTHGRNSASQRCACTAMLFAVALPWNLLLNLYEAALTSRTQQLAASYTPRPL